MRREESIGIMINDKISKKVIYRWNLRSVYIRPIEPAVKPTAKKKKNSRRSLGRELTIIVMWVI